MAKKERKITAHQQKVEARRNKVLVLHKRRLSADDIAHELEISRRLVYDDLNAIYDAARSYSVIMGEREELVADLYLDLKAIALDSLPEVLEDVNATDRYFKAIYALFKLLGVGADVKDLIAMLLSQKGDTPDNFADLMIKLQVAYDERANERANERALADASNQSE